MEQYIPKSALVAEIERIREHVKRLRYAVDANCIVTTRNTCECLESSIDLLVNSIHTLEVKEVDLEKELESFAYTLPHSATGDGEHLGKFDDPKVKEARKHGWSHSWRYNYVKEIAKHFFELGLKSQKGEDV